MIRRCKFGILTISTSTCTPSVEGSKSQARLWSCKVCPAFSQSRPADPSPAREGPARGPGACRKRFLTGTRELREEFEIWSAVSVSCQRSEVEQRGVICMWHNIPARKSSTSDYLPLVLVAVFVSLCSLSEATTLQSANISSKCSNQAPLEKLVVAARFKENVSWMPLSLDVPFLVYQAERRGIPTNVPHKHSNSAREASAFLMFIAEYYDCLPEAVAFVHGHRGSWHNPDLAKDLHLLHWNRVTRYLPLSRLFFEAFGPWFISYPSKPERHLKNPIATGEAATNGTFPKQDIYNGTVYEHDNTFHWQQAKDVATAWKEFFGPAGLGTVPDEIRYFCCAQFAVRKEHIRRQPREFYLQAIHWLDNSPWKGAINPQYSRGLVFETMWHVIMGEDHIMEGPDKKECEVYGCTLTAEQERMLKLEQAEKEKKSKLGAETTKHSRRKPS